MSREPARVADDCDERESDASALAQIMTPIPGGVTQPSRARWRWSIWGSIWLLFLAPSFQAAWTADPVWHAVLGVAGLTLFCLAYALGPPLLFVRPLRDPLRRSFPLLMLALGTAVLPVTGDVGLATYVFVGVIMIMCWTPRAAAVGIVGLLVLAPLLELLVPGWEGPPFDIDLSIALAALASWGVVSVIRRNHDLTQAREELARLAVAEERARFSRDLHDLLGHSLTAISAKAELAGRLVGTDDLSARQEMESVARLAREALGDVRGAVQGYRGVSLPGELASARSVLEAAGIAADLPTAVDDVPGANRELFAWVVREGVTNVVRHSGAHRVRISLTPSSVEVVDDGRAGAGGAGSGLRGLRERVEAAGGDLLAGPVDGSAGWRLRAEVPL